MSAPGSATRPGELALDFDPAGRTEAGISFVGRIRSPWSQGDCPKNLREARERGGSFSVEIAEPYRAGLEGLAEGQAVILLYWMAGARRDLIRQAPRHVGRPRGTFALRSPVRPNPVALATVRIVGLDAAAGWMAIDAIDCFDGTPLIDIKPWLETVDIPPD